MRKQVLTPLLVLILLILATTGVILYGKGYRFGKLSDGRPTVSKTGLLVTTSKPDGAQVFINGNLTSATDDTIDLLPGEYDVKISKDGYFPWEKKVKIEKEVVTKADALLFPTAPRLESITSSGVENPVIDPAKHRIAFRIASQSAKKNGVYVLDMNTNPVLTLQSAAKQLTDDVSGDIFSVSTYAWSPDGETLFASISASRDISTYYQLRTNGFNDVPRNVTAILGGIQDQWALDRREKDLARMSGLKKPLIKMIGENFQIIEWSPDETKILYTASRSAELPLIIKPRRIGIDTMREERNIKQGSMYVYDIQDDINYKIYEHDMQGCSSTETDQSCPVLPHFQWFPDSEHLITIQDKKINVLELDGTNSTTIYAGPFIDSYVFPWPNGSKIVILTNFNNPGVPPTLYTIGLR
jgi:WD40 repeat protein